MAEAREFAQAIHAEFPRKLLAYNCSPSFNWKKKLDDGEIAAFQQELGELGYKYQFVTLAGFHSLNLGMFELAHDYARTGMSAYVKLQEREFALADTHGYLGVRHQRFVGTGYFDAVQETVGTSATTALGDSTEASQFRTAA
jgi:isocitrate lyase